MPACQMKDDRQIAADSSTFSIFVLLNSEVSAPIFTKISHDVEALVQLLIRAFTKRCCILFRNARAKSKDGQF